MDIITLRNHVADMMAATGKTQAGLSRDTGIPQPRLCAFLNGACGLSVRNLFALWPFVYGDFPHPKTTTPDAAGKAAAPASQQTQDRAECLREGGLENV